MGSAGFIPSTVGLRFRGLGQLGEAWEVKGTLQATQRTQYTVIKECALKYRGLNIIIMI